MRVVVCRPKLKLSGSTMSDEFGIQFDDVEQAPPAVRLRPDSNKHFAVAPVFEPQADELPIFVDLDALIDMEEHALSDTRVELGGVMLGGQYEEDRKSTRLNSSH